MLWTVIGLLVLFWILGAIAHIGGGLIHILLVVALVALIFNLLSGRRRIV